jgi:hypothetical protein
MPMYEELEQIAICEPALTPSEAVAELLLKAAYRVGQPGAWTQHFLGRTKDGVGTYVRKALGTEQIHSHCMLGALYCEYDRDPAPDIHAAYNAIVQSVGTSLVADWNDAPTRTQDQVVAALVRAAELVEG